MNKNKSMDNLVSSIISSYERHPGNQMIRSDNLPDKVEVSKIIEQLRRLLFPGYFDKDDVNMTYIEYHVSSLLIDVEFRLQHQICRALNLNIVEDTDCRCMFGKAGELCSRFLNQIPTLRETLLSDIQATYDGDPAACNEHEIIYAYPGVFAISVYRLAHELHRLSVPLIPRMMTEYAHGLTGIDIHPGADISHHFFIDHGTGIVIGETTTIGAYVKLYQGVTLGALSTKGGQDFRTKKRHPTLEDEVTVYSGASILGGETVIGKGSVIGGNAFITQSVPPNTRVSLKTPELDFKGLGTHVDK